MKGRVSAKTKVKMMALAMVLLMMLSVIPASADNDSDADIVIGSNYTYNVTFGLNENGTTVMKSAVKNGVPLDISASDYRSNWEFDAATGIGPFNSFYATFTSDGEFYELLNPNDLDKKIAEWTMKGWEYDKTKWVELSEDSHITTCNTMWVLPTVYLSTSTNGDDTVLTFSNQQTAGSQAYAHTRDGKIGAFMGISVYEGHIDTVNNVLNAKSGETPTGSVTRANFRAAANNTYTIDGQDSMLWNYYQWSLYNFCSYTVSGTMDLKTLYGYGQKAVTVSGLTDNVGPYGTSNDGKSVKCFIENAWGGSMWEFVDDILVDHTKVYIGTNSVANDTVSDKTYIGNYSSSSTRIKTIEVADVGKLGFSLTYTSSTTDCMPSWNLANSDLVSGIVVGGGYFSDATYYNIGSYSYQDSTGTASSHLGSRLSYIFDVSTSGTVGNISWSVDDDGNLYIESTIPGTAVQVPAFDDCGPWARFKMSIVSINFSADINKIGANAFKGLKKVTSITQNGSSNLTITKYGDNAFTFDGNTYPTISIPSATLEIGNGAFAGAILSFTPQQGSLYTYTYPLLFDSSNRLIYISPDYTSDINYTNVPLSSTVTVVADYAGYNISANSVDFPNMTSLGAYAFAQSAIHSLNSTVDGRADLTSISVINDGLLQGCLNIDTVYVSGTNMTDITGSRPFTGMKNLDTIGNTVEITDGTMDLRQFTISSTNNVLFDQQSISNMILNANQKEKIQFAGEYITEMHLKGNILVTSNMCTLYLRDVKNMYFEDGKTTFNDNVSLGSTSIVEKAGIEDANNGLFKTFFQSCVTLVEVNAPNTASFSSYAFSGCTSLKSFNSTDDKIELGSANPSYCCFDGCKSIIEVNGSCTTTGNYSFRNNSALTTVNLPSVITVNHRSFQYCTSLASVTMPKVTTIGEYAFYGDNSLTSIKMESLTTAGNYAFCGCSQLSTCTFPVLTTIGFGIFSGVSSLETYKVNDTDPDKAFNLSKVTSLGGYAFGGTKIDNVLLNSALVTGDLSFHGSSIRTAVVSDDPNDLVTGVLDLSGITTKNFGNGTFYNCKNLSHVKLGIVDLNNSGGYGFFRGCNSLQIVEISPNWTGSFSEYCFCEAPVKYFGSDYNGTSGIIDLRAVQYIHDTASIHYPQYFTKVIVSESSLDSAVNLKLNRFNKMQELELIGMSEVSDAKIDSLFTGNNVFNASVQSVKLIFDQIKSGQIDGMGYLKDRITALSITNLPDGGSYDSYVIAADVFNECTNLTEVRGVFSGAGESAFYGCAYLKTFGLSTDSAGTLNLSMMTVVEASCFEGCVLLTSIKGANLTEVGVRAFYGCTGLNATLGTGTSNLNLSSCTSIGSEAFYGVAGIKGDLALNPTISTLGQYAFYGTGIKTLSVQGDASLTRVSGKIATGAFMQCTSLTSVKLNGISSISSKAFSGCTKLALVILPSASSFGSECFKGCTKISYLTTNAYDGESNGMFISDEIQELSEEFGSSAFPNLTSVTGFTAVTEIAENMFMDARKLTSVSGFDALQNLPKGTFSGCTSLTTVNIPNIVTIGDEAFKGCEAFTEISDKSSSNVVMTNVTTLGNSVFDGCKNLESAILSDSITSMGTYTFNECIALDNIKFPSNLQTIPSYTFKGCGNLLSSASGLLTLPTGVEVIDEHAFDGCSTIRKIVFPDNLEEIRSYAFNECASAFRDASNTFTAPSSMTKIGSYAFNGCTTLYTLDMSDSMITEIGDYAFSESGLKTVKFSPVLKTIGSYAFYMCTSLSSADLPSSLTTIGEYAFYNCKLSVIAIPERVQDISNVFRNIKGLTYVSLPKSTTKGEHAFEMDDGTKHTNTVKVYVNSSSWTGAAPFTSNDNLDIYSVSGSWDVRVTWFNDSITGETKSDYLTVTMPITENEIQYGGYNNPINAIYGSKIVLPSVKAIQSTAAEQKYLYAYSEGGLKVGYSDEIITVYGTMDLMAVETAGDMLMHYTSSNVSVTLQSPTDHYVSYGETFTLEPGVPSEQGVTFGYWQCVLSDGLTYEVVYANTEFTVWRPITEMRAVWNDTQFELKLYYYTTESVLTPLPGYEDPIMIGFGEDIDCLPDITDPSELGYDNYKFDGWFTGPNGTGTKYENGMPMPTRNLSLIANFKPNPHYIDVYLSPADSTVSATLTVYGETTITAIENNNNLIMYTDASNPTAITLINAADYDYMEGKYISEWKINSTTGETLEEGDNLTSSVKKLYAISDDIEYRLIYRFYDVGTAGSPEMTDKDVTLDDSTIRSGDYVSLSYSDFTEDGDDRKYYLGQPKTTGKGFVEWKNATNKTVTYLSDSNFTHNSQLGTYVFEYTVKGNFNGSSFTVSYDKNYKGADNSNLVDSRAYEVGDTIVLPTSTVMKRSGYIFEGWTWTVADDPGNRMPGGTNLEITQELVDAHIDENMVFKFYAQWSAKSYSVLYDINGGTELDGRYDGDLRAYPDVAFNIASFTVKKNDGYRFIGWCVDPEGQGAKVYADGTQGAIVSSAEISEFVGESSSSITLFAIWKKVSYTIKFNLMGGTSTLPLTIEDVKVDEEFSLLPEGTYSSKFKTLKYWHILDNTDEGSSFASTVTKVKLTRGMASAATVENEVNIVTVTAIWTDNRYTVTYDLTLDGKISGSAVVFPFDYNTDGYAIGDEFHYPDSEAGQYTLEGYDFKGWSPIAAGDTKCYSDGEFTATFAGSTSDNKVTFYAVWEKKTYSINWVLSGGILTNSPYTYIDTVTQIDAPVKEGAVFLGWTATDLGTNAYFYNDEGEQIRWTGSLVTATKFLNLQDADCTVTMVANWESKEYTLAYSINGGSCDEIVWTTLRSSIGSDPFDLAKVVGGSRTGYTLEGWSLKDGTYVGKVSTDEETYYAEFTQTMVSASEDGTTVWFYALWKPIKYTVRYYADDEASNYSSVRASYDEAITLDEPIKSGWVFKGWRGVLEGDEAQYSRNGVIWYSWDYKNEYAVGPYFMDLTYESEGVVEVFAQWERTVYDVAYNFNGGTSGDIDGDNTGQVGEDFKFNTSGGSVKTGYTFSGWSVDGVTDVSVGGKFTELMAAYADENDLVTLYAIWAPITYEIGYRYDSSAEYTTVTAMYDVNLALDSSDKSGYSFVGWASSDVDKTTAKYSVTGDYWIQWADSVDSVKGPYFLNLTSVAGNTVHLDAVWEIIEYKVVYNANGGTGEVPTDDSTYSIGSEFQLQSYDSLIGTNGNKNVVGWSTNSEAKVALSIESFTDQLAKTADITNTVTFYAVWVEGMYIVTVDVGDATVSSTPMGWTKVSDSVYTRGFEYETPTTDALESWNSVSITKEGYLFTGWSYDYSKVIDNMTVTPVFEKIMQELLYYCIAAIVIIAIAVFIITRIERR